MTTQPSSGVAGFAERVRVEMARKGWDNKRLATELGVEPKTVGSWVRTERAVLPKPEALEALAATLGVDPGYLMFGPVRLEGPAAALAIIRDIVRDVDESPGEVERTLRAWRAFRAWRERPTDQDGDSPDAGGDGPRE